MQTDLGTNLIQRVCVGDILRRKANAKSAEAVALVEKRGDRILRITYREFNQRINQFVFAMRAAGLGKGDRIGLLGLNSVEYNIALYGCAKGGMVAVPINPGLSPADLTYIANHAQLKFLIVDDLLFPLYKAIRAGLPAGIGMAVIPASGQSMDEEVLFFDDMIGSQPQTEVEDVLIEDRDTFEILYTSGTTDKPKGVVISHLAVFIASLTCIIEFELPSNSISSMLLPVFHCAQQTLTTASLHMSGTNVIFRGFDPSVMLAAIEREKIDSIFCLPAMYRAMLDHPQIKTTDLSSVKKCVYAMTPMDQRTLEEGIAVFGADFMLGTGQTECYPPTNMFKREWQLTKKGNYWGDSCLTLDTAIMDENGNLLPPGTIGEIVWRGPVVMTEYLKNPEATAESRKYGWHHSGDLGFFDGDGLLAFVDRKKDMIKTGGENVPSIKVERVVLAYPGVASAAVVGIPHPHWGEGVTAFVKPAVGVCLTEKEIIAHCAQSLGRFEIPKKVVIVDDLPMTSTGKLRKNVLREQHRKLYA